MPKTKAKSLTMPERINALRIAAEEISSIAFELRCYCERLLKWVKSSRRARTKSVNEESYSFFQESLVFLLSEIESNGRARRLMTEQVRRVFNQQGRGPFVFFGRTSPSAHAASFGMGAQIENVSGQALSALATMLESSHQYPEWLPEKFKPLVRLATGISELGSFPELESERLCSEIQIESDGALASLETPQTSQPAHHKLRLCIPKLTANLDGIIYALTERQVEILGKLIEAKGGRVSGSKLKSYPDESERPGDILRRLPDALKHVWDVQRGFGGGFRITISVCELITQ